MFSKKTKLLFGLIIIFSFILTAGIVLATPGRASLDSGAAAAGYSSYSSDVFSYAQGALNVVLSVVGFIFFGFVLYGGVRWMTARGNDELKQKAKDSLTNAVIGLVIVVGSYAITNFAFEFLGRKEGTVTSPDGATCTSNDDCFMADEYCSSSGTCVSRGGPLNPPEYESCCVMTVDGTQSSVFSNITDPEGCKNKCIGYDPLTDCTLKAVEGCLVIHN